MASMRLRSITFHSFNGSLNSPSDHLVGQNFWCGLQSHCACLGFFLGGENTILNETVVLNGLSCQARSSLVPGTSWREVGRAKQRKRVWLLSDLHSRGGLHSDGSETLGCTYTETSSAAPYLLHSYTVWLAWQHCQAVPPACFTRVGLLLQPA